MVKRLIQGPAEPVWIVDALGEPIEWGTVIEGDPLVYGALQNVNMGNATPVEVVAVNTARRGLVITNCSDTTGYFSFGDGAGLSANIYTWRLYPGQTIEFSSPLSQQAISAVCGAAAKTLGYQEAT